MIVDKRRHSNVYCYDIHDGHADCDYIITKRYDDGDVTNYICGSVNNSREFMCNNTSSTGTIFITNPWTVRKRSKR